jgi:resuscitation-promoting factor RpfA
MTMFREVTAAAGAAGIVAALMASAPAMADPGMPDPQPAVAPGPAPQAVLVPQSGTAPDGGGPVAPAALPTPPNGMPHLSSPQNLPPDTTAVPPDDPTDSGPLGYLHDIWNAYQTQEVDGRGALLMLTQLPMDANAVPPPGLPANPTPPQPFAPGPPPPP